jgi:hypothetical protein
MNERSTRTRAGTGPRLTAALLAVGLLAGACGGDDEAAEAAPDTTDAAAADASSDVPGAELAGRWAHYDIVAYEDPTMKTMIISYGFTDFTVEGDELIESEEFCFAEQQSDQPIETSLADEATQAIKPVSTPVEVTGEPGAWRVQRPATPTPVGIRLEDPANESLPTDPDDPRIVDDDGDGKPGITVVVRLSDDLEGELYIARREIFAYDLVQDGPDSMSGTVTDSSEQLVIGASLPVLETAGGQWEQVADLTLSPILLERVEEDWDCDRLKAERDELFPPNPPIGW